MTTTEFEPRTAEEIAALNAKIAEGRELAIRTFVEGARSLLADVPVSIETDPKRGNRRTRMSAAKHLLKHVLSAPAVLDRLTPAEIAGLKDLRSRWTKGRTSPAPRSPRHAYLTRIVEDYDAHGKDSRYTVREYADALMELVPLTAYRTLASPTSTDPRKDKRSA